ncbi:Transporter, sodium/sulfate symporter family [hydrothermal vent metagenome]|uniref:Transporter, sodium/sulfate symporter family n=1 Tax=hydrothermal vent metagenome TaxID=652676 RepID=A0A3B1ATB1_9ZZZZ
MNNTVTLNPKKLIALAIFILVGLFIASVAPSREIAWICAILLLTIYLFAFEIVEVDIAAISIMVILGLTSLVAPWMGLEAGLIDNNLLFNGFASNAVMSIIAVMIIGAGLDKTGIMGQVAAMIMRFGGSTEKRIIPLISGTVAVISSFMQNVGAAALFLPVVSRISSRTGLPMSRLLMPMGFCAILGGTLTMVGSSPLILLNDLILTSNEHLPSGVEKMETFSLFSVAPIGLALITTGILYFIIAGRFILPANKNTQTDGGNTMQYFKDTYGLGNIDLYEVVVHADSNIINMSVDEFESTNPLRVVAISTGETRGLGSVNRSTAIAPGTIFGILSAARHIESIGERNKLKIKDRLDVFSDSLSQVKSGIAELVIPPGSGLIGKSARDIFLRKTYGLSLLAIHRGSEVINNESGGHVRTEIFQPGDVLVVHTTWANLVQLEKDRDFVVVTTEYPHEELRPQKVVHALVFFVVTLGLVLFSDLKLSVALLFGAIGMVLSGVLKIDEAYQAVSWKTVFLLASLIPLGIAVEKTGTAAWIAQQTLSVVGDMPIWVIQLAVAVLATFFTLVMSNVGATVLLVPLAVNIALGVGANPAVFALTVGIATSNSFLLPTHQVNALIMGPGGYRVADYMKAGGIMTILFLVVSLTVLNLIF